MSVVLLESPKHEDKPPKLVPRVRSGVLSEIGVLSEVLPSVLSGELFLGDNTLKGRVGPEAKSSLLLWRVALSFNPGRLVLVSFSWGGGRLTAENTMFQSSCCPFFLSCYCCTLCSVVRWLACFPWSVF